MLTSPTLLPWMNVSGHEVRLLMFLAQSQPDRDKSWPLDIRAACMYHITSSGRLLQQLSQRMYSKIDALETQYVEQMVQPTQRIARNS